MRFADMFRARREKGTADIFELVRRTIDGETFPPATIVEAATAAGMDGIAVDALADRMRHRDELRRKAAAAEAAEAQAATITAQMERHGEELEAAERRFRERVEPLRLQLRDAEARLAEARAADDALLRRDVMEPGVWERLEAARREEHAAGEAQARLAAEIRDQERRARDGAEELARLGEDPAKVEKLWRDERTRGRVPDAVERPFLDWLRGTRIAAEARKKLPEAEGRLEAAQAARDALIVEARAS